VKVISPRRHPYIDVVVELAWANDPEIYAGRSVATGRDSHARQVKGDGSDKKGYPGPPSWGLGVGQKGCHFSFMVTRRLQNHIRFRPPLLFMFASSSMVPIPVAARSKA
jgi:hypothetical protein